MNIVSHSIWWWKLLPTIAIHWFLKEFSKDENNAKYIYKLFKISWKLSGFCFSYVFYLERWGLFLKVLLHGELADTPSSFLFQSLNEPSSYLSFPSFLAPDPFRNAAVSAYSLLPYPEWPFVSKSFPASRNRLPFFLSSSLSSFWDTSLHLSSFWL